MKKILTPLISVGLLMLLWQLIASGINKPDLIPGIPKLFLSLGELILSGNFYHSVASTLLRGIGGMIISLFAAGIISLLFAKVTWIYELFRPVLVIMRSVPVISFILLALIFLQPESIPFVIAFLTMFPLLSENLTEGLKNLRPELSIMSKTFHLRKINHYTQILYPQLKPFLFSGLASAMGFGWRAIIMGEVLSQCSSGIGSEMKKAQLFIDVPSLMGWTIVAIIISFIFDKGLDKLNALPIPILYHKSSRTKKFPPKEKPEQSLLSTQSIVTLKNISKTYRHTSVLSNLSLTLMQGKIYGLSAPSGSGKSTLLNLINGSVQPTGGIIQVDRTSGISCMFQEPELIPSLSVVENISLPLATLYPKEKAQIISRHYLCLMEMENFATRFPYELSYGQQQRVALARALAYPAPLLLLDEPFKGLDNELVTRIILRIRELQHNSNQTIIFVTHKPEEITLLADIQLNFHNL